MTVPGSDVLPFRILLVEDNPGDADLFQYILRSRPNFNSQVSHVAHLSSALEQLRVATFDAVVLDLGLPDATGLESLRAIMDAVSNLPILVLTGSSDENAGRRALNVGAQDYLIKGEIEADALIRSLLFGYERNLFAVNARRELEDATAKLKRASQTKSEFLANMSHEIRTPLGAMMGFAQLMNDPEQSTADRQDCIATILRNGDQLARVINEILDLSKIESDRLEIENLEFSLVEVVESVAALLNMRAEEKSLAFTVQFSDDVPEHIVSDPTRLRQILFNIVGNAIKFTTAGSVNVRVGVEAGVRGAKAIRITVADTGRGMSAEQRSRVFQAFVQADASTTREYGGTGLGLLLSKRLAEALGGDVVITESAPDVGSTFVVTIALNQCAVAPSAPLVEMTKLLVTAPVGDLSGLKVLVVDDSPDNRVLISHFLIASRATVECAIDGSDAIEKALSGIFDVILMDIQMPKVDGFGALESLRKRDYKPPIIALTAHAMKGDRERCLAAGFDDHICKPIDRKQLVRRLSDLRHAHA